MVILVKGTRFWVRGNGKLYSFVGSVVTPPPPPLPQVVTARIAPVSQKDLSATFTSSASTTSTGTLVSRIWDFGDGGTGVSTIVGANATHTWTKAGTYTVSVTVTNSLGVSNTDYATVTVTAPVAANVAPSGYISRISQNGLTVTMSGQSSTDSDGTIVDYAWDFGDGGASSGPGYAVTHTYATQGDKVITLVVTDDRGGKSVPVTYSLTVNTPPTASFFVTGNGSSVAVDGSASVDRDGGTISSYDWDWGDGSAHGSGAKTSHTYSASGTYTIVLTVADNLHASDTDSKSITVTIAVGYTPFTIEQTKPGPGNTGAGLLRPLTKTLNASGSGTFEAGSYNAGVITLTGPLKDYTITGVSRIIAGANLVENNRITATIAPLASTAIGLVSSSSNSGRIRFNTLRNNVASVQAASGLGGLGTWEYNDIAEFVDGMSPTGAGTTIMQGNYVHELMFVIDPVKKVVSAPGSPHDGEKWSHDDGSQINDTRTTVRGLGNNIEGTWSTRVGALPIPSTIAQLSAVMCNNVASALWRGNWFNGGQFTVNAQNPASGTWTFLNNRYGRTFAAKPYPMWIGSAVASRVTATGEVFEDDGSAIPIYRA